MLVAKKASFSTDPPDVLAYALGPRLCAYRKISGREKVLDDATVAAWRKEHSASIAVTAMQFGISTASV